MPICFLARQLPRTTDHAMPQALRPNRLRIRMIWTSGSAKRSTVREAYHLSNAKNENACT